MAITKYNTRQEYDNDTRSTTESDVSLIVQGNEVEVDGINVLTMEPQLGDAVYVNDEHKTVYIIANTLNTSLIPNSWEYVGEVIEGRGNGHALVLHKEISQSKKYLDVCQYAWTDAVLTGVETTKTIGIRCALDWANDTTVTCVYTATTLTEAAVAMQSAIEARLAELNATQAEIDLWWCYADIDNNRVIVQRDSCSDYRFYNCTGLTHITWGDMPANSNSGMRANGLTGSQKIINAAKAALYYTNSGSTPTANVPLNSATTIVKKACFDDPTDAAYAFCAALREAYGTYDNYIRGEYYVKTPQKMGAFGFPDAETLGKKYGPMTVPTKSGGTKAKFPALNWATTLSFNADGLRTGDFHLAGVNDGVVFMRDNNMVTINTTRQKTGATLITNSAYRWFAQRYSVSGAWDCGGGTGDLAHGNVDYSHSVQAAVLL